MNTIRPLSNLLAGITCFLSAFIGLSSFAQDSSEENTEVYELSPFTVESDTIVGYLATSTLAGTRIRSGLEDIATSISVVTEELLEDTNSRDALDILVYTTGTEVAGVGGNFTAFDVSGSSAQINDQGARNSILTETRIRGLAGADHSRDYFRTAIPFDTYNTERIEINRGSNAVLFGLGSPAGIINNALKQARFQDSNEIGVSVGSYGSHWATVDFNKEIVDDVLAFRFMTVFDNEKFQQDPAKQEDERFYGTFKFTRDLFDDGDDLIGKTTIRGSFEGGKQDANKPRSIPVTDLISPWFHPWDVDVLGTLNMPVKITWNASTQGTHVWPRRPIVDPNNPYPDNARISHHVIDGYFRGPSIIFEGPDNAAPSDPFGNGVIGRQGISNRAVPTPTGGFSTGVFMGPTNLNSALRDIRPALPYAAFYSSPTLSDRTIFDFQTQLIDGPNKFENFNFDAQNFFLEQMLFDDKAGFEIAYAEERMEQEYGGILQSGSRTGLSIDINTVLMDGTPNPNFGRPLTSGSGYWGGLEEERENLRATFFAGFDFTENDSAIMRWLGSHTFTALYSDSKEDRFSFSGVPLTSGRDNIWGRSQGIADSHGRRVSTVHYLGPSLANASTPSGADISGITADQFPTSALAGNGLFRMAGNGLDNDAAPQGQFNTVGFSLIDRAVNGATKTSRDVESLAFVLQSRLLNDILIPTVSWREDELDSRARAAPLRDDDGIVITDFPLIDDDPLLSKASTWNYGVVLKTPEGWLGNRKGISGFNLHFGESENFQPARSRFNPDGSLIGSPTGETQDYGFTLSLFEDKFVVRTTWYETSQVNVGAPGVPSLNTFATIHGRVLTFTAQGDNPNLDPSDPGPEFDFNNDGSIDLDYQPPPQDYLDRVGFSWDPVNGTQLTGGIPASAVQDLETEGVEIELVYNPVENWNIMINAFQQEAISNNAAATFREFVDMPAYDLNGDGTLETNWEDALLGEYKDIVSNTSLNTIELDAQNFFNALKRVEALDGQRNPELREWRLNAITNYRFTEGNLAGFNLGGALRWEDEAAIGYALTEINPGDFNIDVSRPFFGGSETNVDAWIGYARPIMDGKVDWKIQLNIRNLLDDDNLIPIRVNPDGSEVAWRIKAPLEWTLRNTFRF